MAVAFSTDLSTFVPERPIYAVGENSDGSLAWMTNQLMDFQISVDAEEDTKTDANGNTIFSISRAKSCDVSFTTPLLTLELVASMNGSEVERGSNANLIPVPKFETVKLVATSGKVTIDTTTTTISLAQVVRNSGTVGTPVYKVSAAFLTKDGSTRKKLEKGTTTPSSGEFVFTKGSGSADTITVLNADYDEGSSITLQQGNYIVGKDIAPGRYNIRLVSGAGTVTTDKKNEIGTYNNYAPSGNMGSVRVGSYSMFCNGYLQTGDILKLSGIEVTLIPEK